MQAQIPTGLRGSGGPAVAVGSHCHSVRHRDAKHTPHHNIVNPKFEVTALGATFVIVPSGVPGYSYQADVVSVNPGSPLNHVALLPSGLPTSLNPGDAILALDGIPMDPQGVDLGIHEGLTPMVFVSAGSTTPQTGEIII